jgi:hypothetical protein
MSNYHALESTVKQHEVRVAFHIVVPDQDNSVGVNLRTAAKQYFAQTSQVPWLQVSNETEYVAIQNGEIYERVETVEFDADLTVLQKRAILDDRYSALATSIGIALPKILQWWGLDRDVS